MRLRGILLTVSLLALGFFGLVSKEAFAAVPDTRPVCPSGCAWLSCNIGLNKYSNLYEDSNYQCGQLFPGYKCCMPQGVNIGLNNLNGVLCNNQAQAQINTALGCVPVEPGAFAAWLLPNLFKVVGGISFLLMVYGFIQVATSGGDPKVIQGGKETITSAITGLLFSIFAVFLLRLIIVQILHIPGIQ